MSASSASIAESATLRETTSIEWWRWAALIGGFMMLFALQPYAAGYGDLRKSLLAICSDAWFNPQDGTWQHGAMVPFVVGWLVWKKRRTLAAIRPEGEAWGAVLVLMALSIYFIGFKAHNYYLGAASLMLLMLGGIVWLFGRQAMKALFFAWLMLAFLWPLRFLEDTLGFELRFLMVRLSGLVIDALGVPVVRDGTSLISAATDGQAAGEWLRLNIEGPCSGMRSLFALMMVSALFSYHRTRVLWQRMLLFALSLPFAIVGNMVRIFILIVGAALFGQDFAVGDEEVETSNFHFLSGIVVFIVAVFALEGSAGLLKRWTRKRGSR